MRILLIFLSRITPANRRITLDFLINLTESNDFYIYSPHEFKIGGKNVSPLKFDDKLSFEDIIGEFKPDIILLPEHSVLKRESIKGIRKRTSAPKLILENDYYCVEDKEFYRNYNIDLILNRSGQYIDKKEVGVESVLLPFAVPENVRSRDEIDLSSVRRKIVFVGGGRYSNNELYSTRQFVIRRLEELDLLDYFGEIGYDRYFPVLKSYLYGLSDSFPPINAPPMKTFEMMSCGLVVLTTPLNEMVKVLLFGNDECFVEYNVANIEEVVYRIIRDTDRTIEIIDNSLKIINSRHLYKHRLCELQAIFDSILSGRDIPKKWWM